MDIVLALAGDTMLGRGVAQILRSDPHRRLFADEVVEATRSADLFVLNLECCISERGEHWSDPHKPFFFRAPPAAVEWLVTLGVDCVTLANNHALDFGYDALLDTLGYLRAAGIAYVGAGPDLATARAPATLERSAFRVTVIGATDHPEEFAARADRPGVALAELAPSVSRWIVDSVRGANDGAVLVTPHWGPNMTSEPLPRIRKAAEELVRSGATLVAGHSAHVFHGVTRRVLYDLGDFIDDYAVDPILRNDLGLLFFVTLRGKEVIRIETLPLKLDYCHTRVATGEDADWIARRFTAACHDLGTTVRRDGARLAIDFP